MIYRMTSAVRRSPESSTGPHNTYRCAFLMNSFRGVISNEFIESYTKMLRYLICINAYLYFSNLGSYVFVTLKTN